MLEFRFCRALCDIARNIEAQLKFNQVASPTMSFTDPLAQLNISPATITHRGLREYAEVAELVLVEMGADGREHRLTPAAAAAWQALKAAALANGITLIIVSAFRSVQRQAEIIQAKLAAGQLIDDILRSVAPPGHSEHHTGCAVDIASPDHPTLDISFAQTAAFAWLTQQAGRFGFTLSFPEGNSAGYQFEPWHWCFQC